MNFMGTRWGMELSLFTVVTLLYSDNIQFSWDYYPVMNNPTFEVCVL